MSAVITFLEYHRRKRGWFNHAWRPGDRPPAEVIQAFPPRMIPIPNPMIPVRDQIELADFLAEGLARTKGRLPLGQELWLTYLELESRVGEAEASRQVQAIVSEYLKEKAA